MSQQDRYWAKTQRLITTSAAHDLVIEPSLARALVYRRQGEPSRTTGIPATEARTYLSDADIDDLAAAIGAVSAPRPVYIDIFAAPRTQMLPVDLLGRAISGLAEAILFYKHHPDVVTSEQRARDIAEHLSTLGLMIMQAKQTDAVPLSPILIARLAARLHLAATHDAASPELARAWRSDAIRLHRHARG